MPIIHSYLQQAGDYCRPLVMGIRVDYNCHFAGLLVIVVRTRFLKFWRFFSKFLALPSGRFVCSYFPTYFLDIYCTLCWLSVSF